MQYTSCEHIFYVGLSQKYFAGTFDIIQTDFKKQLSYFGLQVIGSEQIGMLSEVLKYQPAEHCVIPVACLLPELYSPNFLIWLGNQGSFTTHLLLAIPLIFLELHHSFPVSLSYIINIYYSNAVHRMIWLLIPHDTLSLMTSIKCFFDSFIYCSLCHRMYCIDGDGTIEIYFQDSSFSSSIDGKKAIYEQHEFRYHTSISLNSDCRTLRTKINMGM